MIQAILFLAAALVFVPLAVRLGLGSVLGYLLAGVVIGPFMLGLVDDPEAILHVSELGVVLMLFLIGLELEPRRLWAMRRDVFGGGSMQMLLCAGLLLPFGLMAGWHWQAALVASLALALSSTAIAVAILEQRKLMSSKVGQSAFAILLYQDIAAIPLLALVAALGVPAAGSAPHAAGQDVGIVLQGVALAGVVVVGRYVAYPVMRFIARMQVRELFTGFALLLVLGVAALMDRVGLSMGLGAFMAGVLLASSEYRHALEIDILPFKGLLLGLFFIAVGMSMDLGLLAASPLRVVAVLLLVVAMKLAGMLTLAHFSGLRGDRRMLLAVLLSQVGEFAFVVIGAARMANVLPESVASLLNLSAALSMATTPLLLIVYDRWCWSKAPPRPADEIENERPAVILAGFGRYGQIVGRLLLASGIRVTVIDHDADTVDAARRFGFKVYFGDAARYDLLESAGIRDAKVIVLAIDDREQIDVLVKLIRQQHPRLRIVARARDAVHFMELREHGVDYVERELFEGSLRSARSALEALGVDRYQARHLADRFRQNVAGMLRQAQATHRDEQAMIATVRVAREAFEKEMLEEFARQEARPAGHDWQQSQ